MAINALNSGAQVWLADLEDANTPHWRNVVERPGQPLRRRRAAPSTSPPRRASTTPCRTPTAIAGRSCPGRAAGTSTRQHLTLDGRPLVGGVRRLRPLLLPQRRRAARARQRPLLLPAEDGVAPRGPALERRLHLRPGATSASPHGTIRATVLIETITAAFEMDEILYELRDHAGGLNAGRWDYLFSIIKNFRDAGPALHPARPQRRDHERADDEGLQRPARQDLPPARRVRDRWHGRVHPERRDAAVNEAAFAKVRADKEREADAGFDGSWVAHPDLVPSSARRSSPGCSATAQPARPAARRRVASRPPTCSRRPHPRRPHRGGPARQHQRRHPLPRRPGCAATARPASTTSWRTPRPPRSRAPRSGSGLTTRPRSPPGETVTKRARRRASSRRSTPRCRVRGRARLRADHLARPRAAVRRVRDRRRLPGLPHAAGVRRRCSRPSGPDRGPAPRPL